MIGIATAFIDSRKEEEREKKGFSFFSISIVSQCIAMLLPPIQCVTVASSGTNIAVHISNPRALGNISVVRIAVHNSTISHPNLNPSRSKRGHNSSGSIRSGISDGYERA